MERPLMHSMTAFGRDQREDQGHRITVEVRALNSRNLDVVLRFPKNCLELEDQTRKSIAERFQRGRIEVFVQMEALAVEQRAGRVNLSLARHYWEQLQLLSAELPGVNLPGLETLLRFPDIFETSGNTIDPASLTPLLAATIASALDALDIMRLREGQALVDDLRKRITALGDAVAAVEARRMVSVGEYQQRLRDRLQDLLGNVQIDEDRLMVELAIFAERSDITEEIVRARSHLEQFQRLLGGDETAPGRKLDFLSQELHREITTIGSKANDLTISQAVVEMKSEIAKVREQVQNIE
ncbi:MAG TPA: YicC family protein [Syntrophobacteraceae bacterium]|nr:YicC family protein [Syntrophobacteraceae bacterium]HBZ56315.1 YicC family protein [Syntrophobacteraceae bacterium]